MLLIPPSVLPCLVSCCFLVLLVRLPCNARLDPGLQTSLVARPPISFDLCKERLKKRLEHHGIEIMKLLDEELCYIPMGGALPKLDQVRRRWDCRAKEGVKSLPPLMYEIAVSARIRNRGLR